MPTIPLIRRGRELSERELELKRTKRKLALLEEHLEANPTDARLVRQIAEKRKQIDGLSK